MADRSPRRSVSLSKRGEGARLSTQLAELIQQSKELREMLVRNERAAAKLRREFERSGSVLQAIESLEGVARDPRELPNALENYETIRRKTRHTLFALGAKQHLSQSELARRFGVSRQLVSRVVTEAGVDHAARSRATRPR